MEKQRGITLIVLIITIAIMLVLTSVSITFLINEGIIGKADEATQATQEAYEQEIEEGKEFHIKGNTYDTLQDYVNTIEREETIEDIMDKALDDRDGTEAVGIGTDGSIVNMEYWYYSFIDGLLVLGCDYPYGSGGRDHPGYIGPIVDGRIVGAVPQYIVPEGEDRFYEVKILGNTFVDIENLEVAPELPSGVIKMTNTFMNCISLTAAPEIPKNVEIMYATFANCTSLTVTTAIPKKVTAMTEAFKDCTSLTEAPDLIVGLTTMESTFEGCTNLRTVPTIPATVKNLSKTFLGCSKLTGTLEINTIRITSYVGCLSGAATDANANLVLTGVSNDLSLIYNTKSSNSHISM